MAGTRGGPWRAFEHAAGVANVHKSEGRRESAGGRRARSGSDNEGPPRFADCSRTREPEAGTRMRARNSVASSNIVDRTRPPSIRSSIIKPRRFRTRGDKPHHRRQARNDGLLHPVDDLGGDVGQDDRAFQIVPTEPPVGIVARLRIPSGVVLADRRLGSPRGSTLKIGAFSTQCSCRSLPSISSARTVSSTSMPAPGRSRARIRLRAAMSRK